MSNYSDLYRIISQNFNEEKFTLTQVLEKYFGSCTKEEILELLKEKYPERFI